LGSYTNAHIPIGTRCNDRRCRIYPRSDRNQFCSIHVFGCETHGYGIRPFTFLIGVIFFLYKLKDIGIYVSLFAVGHSSTLLLGVFADIHINAFLIDAIIGLSVVYKALDNLGAFKQWFGIQPNTKVSTLIFGLFHGFGLAAKIIEFELDANGLFTNLIAFNIGVEIGQLLALSTILILISYWRKQGNFIKHAYSANVILMTCGFILTGIQLAGYFNS